MGKILSLFLKISVSFLVISVVVTLLAISIFAPYLRGPRLSISTYFSSEFSKYAILYANNLNSFSIAQTLIPTSFPPSQYSSSGSSGGGGGGGGDDQFKLSEDHHESVKDIGRIIAEDSFNLNDVSVTKKLLFRYRNELLSRANGNQTLSNDWITIDLNLYVPPHLPSDNISVIIFIPGGGWMLGHVDGLDSFLTHFSKQGPYIIVSVNYRKTPQHVYPAALNDCIHSVMWTYLHSSNIVPHPGMKVAKWIIIGESAGGNLAAATSLFFNQSNIQDQMRFANSTFHPDSIPTTLLSEPFPFRSLKIDAQILFDSCLFFTPKMFDILTESTLFDSYLRYASRGYFVDKQIMDIFWNAYHHGDGSDVDDYNDVLDDIYFAPLSTAFMRNSRVLESSAIDVLESLKFLSRYPSTLLIAPEHDFLRDESVSFFKIMNNITNAFNNRYLQKSSTKHYEYIVVPSTFHGFVVATNVNDDIVTNTLHQCHQFLQKNART